MKNEIPKKKLLTDLKKSEKSRTIRFKNGKEALEYLDKMIVKGKRNNQT